MHPKLAILLLPVVIILAINVGVRGDVLRSGEVRMGSYGYKCVSDCEMKDGTDYYWCEAEHPTNHFKGDYYWDYCSIEDEHDYRGNQCYVHGHACGHHGYRYKWCYTNEDRTEWGYCGYKVKHNRT